MRTRRAWGWIGGALGLLGVLAVASTRLSKPEPPHATFRTADSWSLGEGFTEGGRAFLTHGPAGTVVWDAATWKPRSTWPLLACRIVAIDHDGRLGVGVLGHDDTSARMVVVDLATGEVRHQFEAGRPSLAFASFADEGRSIRAFLVDRQGFVREVATWNLDGSEVARFPFGGPGPGSTGPQPRAVSRDGATFAALDYAAGSAQVHDARTGQALGAPLPIAKAGAKYYPPLAFTPDARTLVVGEDGGRVGVWDLTTARLVRSFPVHSSGTSSLAVQVDPNGRIGLSLGADLRPVSGLGRLFDDARRSLGLSQGGNTEVVVFGLATGQVLARWRGSTLPHFAPDGRTVVTQEDDGSLSVRDVPTPAPE